MQTVALHPTHNLCAELHSSPGSLTAKALTRLRTSFSSVVSRPSRAKASCTAAGNSAAVVA